MTDTPREQPHRSFGGGFLLAVVANVGIAMVTIPIAGHWNARGGEEWAVGLVVAGAVLTGLLGIAATVLTAQRGWGIGLVAGAVLAPLLVGATFVWYYAILHGS